MLSWALPSQETQGTGTWWDQDWITWPGLSLCPSCPSKSSTVGIPIIPVLRSCGQEFRNHKSKVMLCHSVSDGQHLEEWQLKLIFGLHTLSFKLKWENKGEEGNKGSSINLKEVTKSKYEDHTGECPVAKGIYWSRVDQSSLFLEVGVCVCPCPCSWSCRWL